MNNSRQLNYLVPIYHTDEDGYFEIQYFITYESESKDFDTMDKIVDQTWNDEPLFYKLEIPNGRIVDLSTDNQSLHYHLFR